MEGNRFSKSTMLRWKGAYAAAISVFAGVLFFVFIDSLLFIGEIPPGWWILTLATFAGLFSLPFSLVAGYLLGWFLEIKRWHLPGDYKPIVAGATAAAISITVIFMIGGILQTCLTSHGMCNPDPIDYIWTSIKSEFEPGPLSEIGKGLIIRFVEAFFIAIVSGAITGHYLSKQGSHPTTKSPDAPSLLHKR